MNVHHIFIFTEDQDQLTNELLALGFAEGSSRVHPGQGTACRKFYFENFYLELLWVNDDTELRSAPVQATGLGLRAHHRATGFAPFGLCVVREAASDALFAGAHAYQPVYLPPGTAIDVLPNTDHPTLPWTFRLPFEGKASTEEEPLDHPNGVARLTGAWFEYRGPGSLHYLARFAGADHLVFTPSDRTWLTLVFDEGQQGLSKTLHSLNLTLRY